MKKCPKCGSEYPDSITLCPVDGLGLESTEDSLIGQILAGKYRVDERLSEGGMGKVYRGTHVLMGKTVAIKVMRPALAADEKIVARFSREARAASRITHPHALSVTDFGEDENGRVFLVMEYLQGRTLKEIIRKEGPMDLGRVVGILRQVAGALDAAHGEKVVHRDLKSENIMLLDSTSSDHAKVLDFGIAKINEPEVGYDSELTAPNLVIGTPQYMSPEQCSQASEIDSRSDIYSLGIILFEMLVGHVPFSGDSPTNIMMRQMQQPAPSVLDERPDLPRAVDKVVARALEKQPDDRYQRAGDLVEDLTIAASGSGVAIPADTEERETSAATRDLPDEETIVRPRPQQVRPIPDRAPITVRTEAPVASTFNPWKVLIPSAAGLLVVFAVIYAFTRGPQPATMPPQNSLVADPNSNAVEPAQPATGASEQGIPAGGTTSVPAANANANASPNATFEPSASPMASEPVEENANENENENVNSNKNVNSNANRKAPPLPSPSRPVNVNEAPPPPPSPAATKVSTPQTTLPAAEPAGTPR